MKVRSKHNSDKMLPLPSECKRFFPLRNFGDVVLLFENQILAQDGEEPNLTLLSIVAGYIESMLTGRFTGNSDLQSGSKPCSSTGDTNNFPVLEWSTVDSLYGHFQAILAAVIDNNPGKGKGKQQPQQSANNNNNNNSPSRETIKYISDLIWNSLIRSTYKDRAHLQSLYSYLTTSKLDCFGVAFAVVAGCQMLGYRDVNLAISEDHVWVTFGAAPHGQRDTIEVTWHGKGSEDKRGQAIQMGVDSQSWLYLGGNAVTCDRYMEVTALVLAINPSLGVTSACLEVTNLQQQLLWLLYDRGHLHKYPMGLGNLGELEELSPSEADRKRPTSEELYKQGVESARRFYKNYHVYPYTYLGGYYYRKCQYRESFAAWAETGDVIRMYVHSREDEEIYKELLDIANEQIPAVMKTEGSGHSAKSILRDANCFANLLRFYDGICKWEEGSVTPILHIGWAKPLVSTIGKFDYDIRRMVKIETATDEEEFPSVAMPETPTHNIPAIPASVTTASELPPTLAALTAACGEKILNPDFLLQGDGHPFTEVQSQTEMDSGGDKMLIKLEPDKYKSLDSEQLATNNIPAHSCSEPKELDDLEVKQPTIKLYSQKMKGVKNLLLSEKLNTQAILLQVTAQSQVGGRKAMRVSAAAAQDTTQCEKHGAQNTAAVPNNGTSHNQAPGQSTVTSVQTDEGNSNRPKRSRRD